MNSTLECPASYELEGGGCLVLSEVVRTLPGRRLVCRGAYGGEAVYAKLFFGSKGQRDAGRDENGSLALAGAGVLTPELLFSGRLTDHPARVLVYAAVAGSATAEAVLAATSGRAARAGLMGRLAVCVATHHRAGLMQTDIYLKNFLVAADRIYSLDGDGIRDLPRLGRARAALDNLAALLSKFDADDDGAIAQAFAGYCDALGQTARHDRQRWLQRRVAWHRLRAARRFADHKVYRNCSDIAVQTAFRQFLAIVRQPGLTELRACLDQLPALVRRPDLCFLKRGNTCTVMACPLDGRDRVIKRYNIKSFWHALSRAWRPSRAARSWSNAHRLGMLGIETARPLALVESRWGPLRGEAYFFSDRVPGRDARALFDDTQASMETRQQVASAIAAMLHKLWRLGLVHGDMKAGNILVTADGRPVMLDLDAMFEARCRWRLHRGHARDLKRWMKNWQDAPQTAELMQAALKAVYQNDDILRAAGIV